MVKGVIDVSSMHKQRICIAMGLLGIGVTNLDYITETVSNAYESRIVNYSQHGTSQLESDHESISFIHEPRSTIRSRDSSCPYPIPAPINPPSVTPSQSQNQMQRRPTLQIILLCRLIVRHLFPPKNQPLLHRRNPLFLLHSLFYPRYFVVGLNV